MNLRITEREAPVLAVSHKSADFCSYQFHVYEVKINAVINVRINQQNNFAIK